MVSAVTVSVLTEGEIRGRLAAIESDLPGIGAVFSDPDVNHGDSCWFAEFDWDPLCGEYDRLMWLLG